MFVLVADNQAVFQQMLAQILRERGVDFHICSSGAEIIEAMSVRKVDLFVITMNLPDMDAPSLCRRIRDAVNDECVPIIVLTSEARGQSFAQVFGAGATDIFRRNKIEYFSDYVANLTEIAKPLRARVMILEDSRSQRQWMQQSLIGWGLTVDSFESSQPALRAHLVNPYDLILTDIELNGLENGLDFVHDIRQQGMGIGDVPIIAITAYLSESTRVNFLARGIDRCMLKPILMPELRSEIKKQLDARQAKLTLESARQVEVEKNRAKTAFLARMSHELRTSLNAIIGFSNLLITDDSKDPETLDCGHKINNAGKLLLDLINEMLDLSYIESGNVKMSLEAVNLADILEKCQAVVNPFAEDHGVKLKFVNTANGICVRCDAVRLTEVLLNLISNGIKYNQRGGLVEVVVEKVQAGFVRISVRDNGIGISVKDSQKIFEPFTRVHTSSHPVQGTGIGLPIAQQLVELMGGKLGFVSEVGKGSTFWVDIPVTISGSEKRVLPSSTFSKPLKPCKVLYVDDNPVNRVLLEKWFSRQPQSSLLVAGSAKEGLALMSEESPDIVITDIHMPEESGYWLLDQIRKNPSSCSLPVVALSAMAMDDEVEQGELSDFSAYLTKPFDFEHLVEVLNSCLDELAVGDYNNSPSQYLPGV